MDISELQSDLAEIVVIWPKIPDNIKAAFKTLIQAHIREIR